ncbi:MAG: hypothetical protein PHH54_01345 [Candidatus Nanoarchaeia archaeon]|nr:hypothetical protein [Candidatus Nanoarchaeia archaeon]MDD5740608.1 hypothetical protein [Candidatus Nanoarchaeia archaeon]
MKQKKEVNLRKGNIGLILDSYDDIFSDFDPRPYNVRALSDDFLLECKKASVDKNKELELRFLIPKHNRNTSDEYEIRKRLRNHFQKHFKEKETEIKEIKRDGLIWFFLGAVIMIAATFLYKLPGFLFNLLFIITEPAGWFFFWEGLNKIFKDANQKKPEYDFYRKMSKAHIYFLDY